MTEWDYLVEALGIEEGDMVAVENEEGETEELEFMGTTKVGIYLRDSEGEEFVFSKDSLEELDEPYRVIVGS